MSALPVYILKHVALSDPRAVNWTDVCDKPDDFIHINYSSVRYDSRGIAYVRRRPFSVYLRRKGRISSWQELSSHYTLEAAEKSAAKLAAKYGEQLAPKAAA